MEFQQHKLFQDILLLGATLKELSDLGNQLCAALEKFSDSCMVLLKEVLLKSLSKMHALKQCSIALSEKCFYEKKQSNMCFQKKLENLDSGFSFYKIEKLISTPWPPFPFLITCIYLSHNLYMEIKSHIRKGIGAEPVFKGKE